MKHPSHKFDNKDKEITWAPLIPLIGGFPLGAEEALGQPPCAILSYSDFAGNDNQYVNHMQKTRGLDIDYLHLDNEDHQEKIKALGKINILVGTPPCAALSQLNTGKSDEVKGSSCQKNQYMYWVFRDGIEKFNADVIAIENAPALYTKKGKGVADKMQQLASKYGYSFSLYKTSTHHHGLPQKRDRTFALMWNSKAAPVMEWYKRETKDFTEYLADVPSDALQQDVVIHPGLTNEPYYQFIKHHTGNDPRIALIEEDRHTITCFNWINNRGLLQVAADWFKETDNEKGIKYSTHALKKFADGLGIWDGSVHVFDKAMNAVIGRNMNDTIHPIHDRSLTLREAMYMMGMPLDFELLGGRSASNMIAQNVPASTARDIAYQMRKFINGELLMSNESVMKQNNHKECIDHGSFGATLTNFV